MKNSINVHDKLILNTLWDIVHPQTQQPEKEQTEAYSQTSKAIEDTQQSLMHPCNTLVEDTQRDNGQEVVTKRKKRKHIATQEDTEQSSKIARMSSQELSKKKKKKQQVNGTVKKHKKKHK